MFTCHDQCVQIRLACLNWEVQKKKEIFDFEHICIFIYIYIPKLAAAKSCMLCLDTIKFPKLIGGNWAGVVDIVAGCCQPRYAKPRELGGLYLILYIITPKNLDIYNSRTINLGSFRSKIQNGILFKFSLSLEF